MNNEQAVAAFLNICEHMHDNIWTAVAKISKSDKRYRMKLHLDKNVRSYFGAHSTVFHLFYLNDHEEFHQFVSMSVPEFVYLFELVRNKLKTNKRELLPEELRLDAVLKWIYIQVYIYIIWIKTIIKILIANSFEYLIHLTAI